MCAAKVHLETHAQGKFQYNSDSFVENCDYKALSPRFHAIATSKHSYV